jgi:hypothetical protein
MSTALIVRDDTKLTCFFTEEAHAERQRALEAAALVGKVTDAHENDEAVKTQTGLATVARQVEQARKAAKEPVLNFGRQIDATAAEFVKEVKGEEMRVARLIGDFQTLQLAKQRAAEQAERDRLSALERERLAALAQAQSHEELEKVQETFNARAKEEAPPIAAPIRATGQTVREDWEFEVTDIWLLARAHANCVSIEPRRAEIKSLLSAGVQVAGVRAWRGVKSGVRTSTVKAIDV